MGAIWGVFRDISGSLVVSSVSHGLWNGVALNALVLLAIAKTLNKTEPNPNTLYFSA